MSVEKNIRSSSRSSGRIMSLYQVDPGFYRMIISRTPSLGSGGPSTRRSSVYRSAANGKVPFMWEMEPGEPKSAAAGGEALMPPIRPPPGAHRGLSVPIPASKTTKMMMMKKKRVIHLGIPRPRKALTAEAKAYLKNNIKKVKQIAWISPLTGRDTTNKEKEKEKPRSHDHDHDHHLEFDVTHHSDNNDDLITPSSSHETNPDSSWSSSYFSDAPKSEDKSRSLLSKLWRLPKGIFKFKNTRPASVTS